MVAVETLAGGAAAVAAAGGVTLAGEEAVVGVAETVVVAEEVDEGPDLDLRRGRVSAVSRVLCHQRWLESGRRLAAAGTAHRTGRPSAAHTRRN